MNFFSPQFNGRAQIRTPRQAFLAKFKQRIESGLLTGRPHRRSRYIVCRSTDDELSFQASDLLTAINVGLNSVNLRCAANNSAEYQVSYRRWAAYAVVLSAGIAGVLIVLYFGFGLDAMMQKQQVAADTLRSRRCGLAIFWGSVAFWGFVWPWLLVVMHKGPARKLLTRIIQEVDKQEMPTE